MKSPTVLLYAFAALLNLVVGVMEWEIDKFIIAVLFVALIFNHLSIQGYRTLTERRLP